jgi:hypothetical protein
VTAFNYARSQATADRLIKRFGQTGTLRRPTSTGPGYNPTAGEPEDHSCTFVVEDYTNREIDGARILATDKKVLLSKVGLAIEPATSDKLVVAGAEHHIIRIAPLSPAGTVVFYELQVRR